MVIIILISCHEDHRVFCFALIRVKKQEKPCLAMYIKTWFLFGGNKSSHFFFVVVVVACHNWFTHTHTYGWSAKNVCLLKKEYSSPLFHEHQQGFFLMKICQMSEFFLGWNNFVLSGFQFFYKEMGFNALSEQKKKKRKEIQNKNLSALFFLRFL